MSAASRSPGDIAQQRDAIVCGEGSIFKGGLPLLLDVNGRHLHERLGTWFERRFESFERKPSRLLRQKLLVRLLASQT
jgi:hypothetical protein